MALAPPPKSCAPSSRKPSPNGSSPTPSSSSTPFPAPPSANSRNSPSASNSPTGNGSRRDNFSYPRLDLSRTRSPHSLGSVTSIDAHIFRGEVAGPVARPGFAGVQIHHQRNVLGKKLVAGGALVEIERLAAPQHRNARHLDVHKSGIRLYSGTPGRGEDASPVWIAARESGFHQRRSRDGFRDAFRRGFGLRVAHFDFDDALRAFAVRNDLQRKRVANFFERRREPVMRRRACFDRRSTCFAIRQNQQGIVRGSVAVDADGVERARSHVAQSF